MVRSFHKSMCGIFVGNFTLFVHVIGATKLLSALVWWGKARLNYSEAYTSVKPIRGVRLIAFSIQKALRRFSYFAILNSGWCWMRKSRGRQAVRLQMPPLMLKAKEGGQIKTQVRASPSQRGEIQYYKRKRHGGLLELLKKWHFKKDQRSKVEQDKTRINLQMPLQKKLEVNLILSIASTKS